MSRDKFCGESGRASLAVVAGAAIGVLLVATVAIAKVGIGPAVTVVDESSKHRNATRDRLVSAIATGDIMNRLSEFGLEPGGAGLHAVRPYPDPYVEGAPQMYDGFQERNGYWFWSAEPVYDDVSYDGSPLAIPVVPATTLRVWANDIMSYSVAAEGDGEYSVHGQFDAASIQLVSEFLRPSTGSSGYVDWYGIVQASGEVPTPLIVTLVADGKAYEVFHADQVAASAPGYTVVLARDLSQAAANELLHLLTQ